jgi:hypothetical protein
MWSTTAHVLPLPHSVLLQLKYQIVLIKSRALRGGSLSPRLQLDAEPQLGASKST